MSQAARDAAPAAAPAPARRPPIQAKLRIGPVDDPLEREADRIADAVVSGEPVGTISRAAAGSAQRQCAECEEEDGKSIQRKCGTCAAAALHADTVAMAASAVSRGGAPLTAAQRAYFEPRFGRDLSGIRIHTDAAAGNAAAGIRARAYTLGEDIGFGFGEYLPREAGFGKLLAHELAHTAQQAPGATIRRQPSGQTEIEMPAQWAFAHDERKRTDKIYARRLAAEDSARIRKAGVLSTQDREEVTAKLRFFEDDAWQTYSDAIRPALVDVTPEEIEMPAVDVSGAAAKPARNPYDITEQAKKLREYPEYIDNNIKEVNYFTAELAHIHYKNGSKYELGLVPRWMKPPVVEVNCHTEAQDFRQFADAASGKWGFIVEAEMAKAARTVPYQELLKTYVRYVDYYVGPGDVAGSVHIVPSRINMLTAPTLCGVLRDSERRFKEQVDLGVQVGLGGTVAMSGYAGAGGFGKAPGLGAAPRIGTRAVLSPTARTAAREMEALLGQGGTKTIEAGGVRFTDIAVAKQGNNLAVKYFEIRRFNAPPGGGKLAQEAFEDAAANVARSHGMKSVTIDVGVIVNPGFRQWMESMGYVFVQTEGAWIKTIKL